MPSVKNTRLEPVSAIPFSEQRDEVLFKTENSTMYQKPYKPEAMCSREGPLYQYCCYAFCCMCFGPCWFQQQCMQRNMCMPFAKCLGNTFDAADTSGDCCGLGMKRANNEQP